MSTKFENVDQIWELWPNLRTLTKFENFDQICELRPNLWISTKFENFDKIWDVRPNLRISSKFAKCILRWVTPLHIKSCKDDFVKKSKPYKSGFKFIFFGKIFLIFDRPCSSSAVSSQTKPKSVLWYVTNQRNSSRSALYHIRLIFHNFDLNRSVFHIQYGQCCINFYQKATFASR